MSIEEQGFVLRADDSISPESTVLFADFLRASAKPVAEWRCGLEWELIGYRRESLERINGHDVQQVLRSYASSFDRLYYEGEETLVELCVDGLGHITVEPGGQIEFSGRPRETLYELEQDLDLFLRRLNEVAKEQGTVFVAAGFDPLRTIFEQQWFPKMRYEIMRPFLAARGRRAWDMMCRTSAAQINLDFCSEDDLSKKYIVGNRLAPIITAIFANSPFENGRPSAYKSTRAAAWLETDDDRTCLSPLAAAGDEISFESFVNYTLDVPMIFVRRDHRYFRLPKRTSFRGYLAEGAGEFEPIFQDWTDHLTTIFTDARLKRYIELRSADSGGPEMALALAGLWKGLMYDPTALDEAAGLVPRLSLAESAEFRRAVAREALAARFAGHDVLSLAKEVIAIAADGLKRIAPEEESYLDVLRQLVIEDGLCPADILLRNWYGSWNGSIKQAVEHLQIAPR